MAGGVTGIVLAGGGLVNNAASGVIEDGVELFGPGGVDNYGSIGGGVIADGALTNHASATITNFYYAVVAPTVVNAGFIWSAKTGGVFDLAVSVTNLAGGTIEGRTAGVTAGKGTVDNSGTISAAYSGVIFTNYAGSVDNSGSIFGKRTAGVFLKDGGTITNEAGGTIAGKRAIIVKGAVGNLTNSGYIHGVVAMGGGGTVANASSGLISGGVFMNWKGTVDNAGRIARATTAIYLTHGGRVTNEASGTINSFSVVDQGGAGVRIAGLAGTVDNAGTIVASNVGGVGISLAAGGTIVNEATGWINARYEGIDLRGVPAGIDNFGHIKGARTGVYLHPGGTLVNEAGGAIRGGVYGVFAKGASATVENAGMISGGPQSVRLAATASNRLIVDAGAVFNGNAVAVWSTSANTIELTGKDGAGVLNGLGSTFQGFQTVTIDPGAAWKIKGAEAGFDGVTIAGFGTTDTLDLTDLAFAAGDFATLNSATDVLTIRNGGGTALAAVQLSGNFSGQSFTVASDGSVGSKITLGKGLKSDLTGTYASGVVLTSATYANPVTVTATGRVFGISAATRWTIDNYGTVEAGSIYGAGIDIEAAGLVTNTASGTIHGGVGVRLAGNGTVNNAGVISGNYGGIVFGSGAGTVINSHYIGGHHKAGVYLKDGGVITNKTNGIIEAYSVYAEAIQVKGASATVMNSGYIGGIGLDAGGTISNAAPGMIYDSVEAYNVGATVNNSGEILNGIGSELNGVNLAHGGSVTNAASGLIKSVGATEGIGTGVAITGASGTVVNSGTIVSFLTRYGNAVFLGAGGTVTNEAGGTLTASSDPAVDIQGNGGSGSVDNSGHISGRLGIFLETDGRIVNRSSGFIGGGIVTDGPLATVENAGTITGYAYSVMLEGSSANRLIVDAGAVFNGAAVATNATAANTLQLTSAAGAGTLSGLGSTFRGFQTVAIDGGAAWAVAGKEAGFAGVTIGGFNTHDTLDLTDAAFSAGATATLNSATDVLTIKASGGSTIAQVQLAGSFAGYTFGVSSDGTSGIDVTMASTSAAIHASRPSAYRQMTRLIQAVAMDRSALSAFAQPTAPDRPRYSVHPGALAQPH
jgi:hypothetical protein